jgi:hypothetical protein
MQTYFKPLQWINYGVLTNALTKLMPQVMILCEDQFMIYTFITFCFTWQRISDNETFPILTLALGTPHLFLTILPCHVLYLEGTSHTITTKAATTCSNGLFNFQHTITITPTQGCTLQFVFLMMGFFFPGTIHRTFQTHLIHTHTHTHTEYGLIY